MFYWRDFNPATPNATKTTTIWGAIKTSETTSARPQKTDWTILRFFEVQNRIPSMVLTKTQKFGGHLRYLILIKVTQDFCVPWFDAFCTRRKLGRRIEKILTVHKHRDLAHWQVSVSAIDRHAYIRPVSLPLMILGDTQLPQPKIDLLGLVSDLQ